MNNYLVGSGHFAIGFCLGFLVMLYLVKKYKDNLKIQMYSPFAPFLIGAWAALPYIFIAGSESNMVWLNIFIFFDYFHHSEIFIAIFGQLYLVVLICGSVYLYILMRYITLVKYCRRYGSNEGNSNA